MYDLFVVAAVVCVAADLLLPKMIAAAWCCGFFLCEETAALRYQGSSAKEGSCAKPRDVQDRKSVV